MTLLFEFIFIEGCKKAQTIMYIRIVKSFCMNNKMGLLIVSCQVSNSINEPKIMTTKEFQHQIINNENLLIVDVSLHNAGV